MARAKKPLILNGPRSVNINLAMPRKRPAHLRPGAYVVPVRRQNGYTHRRRPGCGAPWSGAMHRARAPALRGGQVCAGTRRKRRAGPHWINLRLVSLIGMPACFSIRSRVNGCARAFGVGIWRAHAPAVHLRSLFVHFAGLPSRTKAGR